MKLFKILFLQVFDYLFQILLKFQSFCLSLLKCISDFNNFLHNITINKPQNSSYAF